MLPGRQGHRRLRDVLNGQVDAIFCSGGLVYNDYIVEQLRNRVEFIAPLHLYPGEKEMEALSQGGIRVLNGTEQAQDYNF